MAITGASMAEAIYGTGHMPHPTLPYLPLREQEAIETEVVALRRYRLALVPEHERVLTRLELAHAGINWTLFKAMGQLNNPNPHGQNR